jgi:hypothetical protein
VNLSLASCSWPTARPPRGLIPLTGRGVTGRFGGVFRRARVVGSASMTERSPLVEYESGIERLAEWMRAGGRKRMRLQAATLALVISAVLSSCANSPAAAAGPPVSGGQNASNGSVRFLMWTDVSDCIGLSDAQLLQWKSRGAGGFVCQVNTLAGMGGTQAFAAAPPKTLAEARYSLERRLVQSKVVSRASKLGMTMYLGFWFTNASNTATPLANWFDDASWQNVVLPDVEGLAGAAHMLGFAGIAFDQEMYALSKNGVATWNWDYPGNTHTEGQTRAEVRHRGQQMMRALLRGFPNIKILAYDTLFPGTWDAQIRDYAKGTSDAYESSVQINFWDGLTAVDGYARVLFLDAMFYRDPGLPGASWDAALQYQDNSLFAVVSQRFSNWAYASSRVAISPFAWIDNDAAGGIYNESRPQEYVAGQLQALRRWSMDGTFGIFAFDPLNKFDYTPYVAAMRAVSVTEDPARPKMSVGDPKLHTGSGQTTTVLLHGSAVDRDAVRAVYWKDASSKAWGAARMVWQPGPGSDKVGWDWTMNWSLSASVPKGTKSIEIEVVSIKGATAVAKVSLTAGGQTS